MLNKTTNMLVTDEEIDDDSIFQPNKQGAEQIQEG